MKNNETQIQLETTNESFFRVFDWMFQKLGLTGNELLVFAVIFDCTRRFNNANPSSDQILARCGVESRTLRRILGTFAKRKLVNVERVPGRTSAYSINEDVLRFVTPDKMTGVDAQKYEDYPGQNVRTTPDKMSGHPGQNVRTPRTKCPPLKEGKEGIRSLKETRGAHACASADSQKNPSLSSTDYDTECLNIFWKLYPETRKKNIDSIRDDFLAIPSEEYPLLLSVLHHKLFDSELGDEWRRQDGRFIPGIKRYLSDQYWKKEDNRCPALWEYTPEGIEMSKSTPEEIAQLSQNLKELRII